MRFPPDGCTYEVHYQLGRRGSGQEAFTDEFALGRWFRSMVDDGVFDPVEFADPDEDGRNGYQIFCVTVAGKMPISYFHPRMVRGRIESARE